MTKDEIIEALRNGIGEDPCYQECVRADEMMSEAADLLARAEVAPLERLILESAMAWYRQGIKDGLTSEDYEGHSLTEWNACAALLAAQLDSSSMNSPRSEEK